eukprot:TRINITY_DN2324_c1_g1_i2.p1 TRINITY_DN2324_c1_g1~~TRINITY_DN2324_c1_g1_i2.p1  ORF type:complete len:1266 (-),score=264.50 TRINITY_DN2324_c1_g1_i2:163-3960(-)
MGAENLSTIFGGMVSILSNVMNAFDKSKFCRILIQEFPRIFQDIDVLPLSEASGQEASLYVKHQLPPNALQIYTDNGTYKSIMLPPNATSGNVSRILRGKLQASFKINASTFLLYEFRDREIRRLSDEESISEVTKYGSVLVFSGLFRPEQISIPFATRVKEISRFGERVKPTVPDRPERREFGVSQVKPAVPSRIDFFDLSPSIPRHSGEAEIDKEPSPSLRSKTTLKSTQLSWTKKSSCSSCSSSSSSSSSSWSSEVIDKSVSDGRTDGDEERRDLVGGEIEGEKAARDREWEMLDKEREIEWQAMQKEEEEKEKEKEKEISAHLQSSSSSSEPDWMTSDPEIPIPSKSSSLNIPQDSRRSSLVGIDIGWNLKGIREITNLDSYEDPKNHETSESDVNTSFAESLGVAHLTKFDVFGDISDLGTYADFVFEEFEETTPVEEKPSEPLKSSYDNYLAEYLGQFVRKNDLSDSTADSTDSQVDDPFQRRITIEDNNPLYGHKEFDSRYVNFSNEDVSDSFERHIIDLAQLPDTGPEVTNQYPSLESRPEPKIETTVASGGEYNLGASFQLPRSSKYSSASSSSSSSAEESKKQLLVSDIPELSLPSLDASSQNLPLIPGTKSPRSASRPIVREPVKENSRAEEYLMTASCLGIKFQERDEQGILRSPRNPHSLNFPEPPEPESTPSMTSYITPLLPAVPGKGRDWPPKRNPAIATATKVESFVNLGISAKLHQQSNPNVTDDALSAATDDVKSGLISSSSSSSSHSSSHSSSSSSESSSSSSSSSESESEIRKASSPKSTVLKYREADSGLSSPVSPSSSGLSSSAPTPGFLSSLPEHRTGRKPPNATPRGTPLAPSPPSSRTKRTPPPLPSSASPSSPPDFTRSDAGVGSTGSTGSLLPSASSSPSLFRVRMNTNVVNTSGITNTRLGNIQLFEGELYDNGHKPSLCFLNEHTILEIHKSQNRATVFYRLGKYQSGNIKNNIISEQWTPWKIVWGSSKNLATGDVPIVTCNGNGIVLQSHKSSPSSVILYSIGRHDPDTGSSGKGSISFSSSHKWASGDSPSMYIVGNKVAGVYVKNKTLRRKFGVISEGSSKITWLPITSSTPELTGLTHPTFVMNELGMFCIIFEQTSNGSLMCVAGRVQWVDGSVEYQTGSVSVVALEGRYPKASMTADGIIFLTYHSSSHVMCNRVGRWNESSSVGMLVSWKPLNETNQHGAGQKGGIAIIPNKSVTKDVAPFFVALAYQGTASDKKKLFYKLGYYFLEQ